MGKKLLIIHLDDHELFKKGIRLCLQEHYKDAIIRNFSDNQNSLIYIHDCFIKKINIDLIITDYNHIGLNGLIFAQEVRKMEVVYNIKIPIILLTMRLDDETLVNATKKKIFNEYFTKDIECKKLVHYLEGVSFNN